MLTVVEHEEHPAVPQRSVQRGRGVGGAACRRRRVADAEGRRHRLDEIRGIGGQAAELDEPHAVRHDATGGVVVRLVGTELLGDGQRQARLAHSAGSGQRDEPLGAEEPDDGLARGAAPDESRRRRGQVPAAGRERARVGEERWDRGRRLQGPAVG